MRSFPIALLVLAACGGPVVLEPTPSSHAEALTTTNGTNLNGTNLNGTNLNGTDPGATLAAVSLSAVRLEDKTLDATWLDGSMFRGQRNGSTVAGRDFVGAQLDGTTASGATVRVRLADVLAPADGSDVWGYAVEFADAAGTWQPLCPTDGTPRLAIPVQGRWDYRQGVPGGGARIADDAAFTFGCEGAAIAKCVRMGYRPWASFGGVDGVALHQACVRLIRADYCGDGLSHTTNGRTINLYDGLGIQEDTEAWFLEAEWDDRGARCTTLLNRGLLGELCGITEVLDLGCGSKTRFSSGTLLMSETPSGPIEL